MITNINQLAPGYTWPPAGEAERLKRYKANKLLFKGHHDKVFGDWVRLLREDQMAILEIVLNYPKRLSTLWADLLFGQPPTIKLNIKDNEKAQEYFNKHLNEDFFNNLYSGVIDQSRYGESIIKNRYNEGAKLDILTPALWFPVCSPENVKDTQFHVIGYTFTMEAPVLFGMSTKEEEYLRLEIHGKGVIYNRLFKLVNGVINDLVAINTIFPGVPETVQTGVNDFLVIPVPNIVESDEFYGLDDYEDIGGVLQELETRFAQISRILDKHSDPGMYGPESALEQDLETGQWIFKAGGKYIPVSEGENIPGYLTFDGKLDPGFKQIDILMEQLYILSETSPAIFGQLKSGLAESGSALKRLLMAPLAKARRLQTRWDSAIKRALKNMLLLENSANNLGLKEEDINISITWADPLPKDEREEAEIMQIRTGQKATISQKAAIKKMGGLNDDETEEELKQIISEANAETPVMFRANLNTPPQPAPNNTGE